MKKFFLFAAFLSIFTGGIYARPFSFGWITDTHVGFSGAGENLSRVVADANKKGFPFILVTGDMAEKGRDSELEEAKDILDSLTSKYYAIPGNHDTKWSESGCTRFAELWGADKFYFEYEGINFIGLNSGIILRGGGGHITPEDVAWFDETLKKIPNDKEIIIITHHPLDGDIDNWFEVTNRLKGRNVLALLYGHGHYNKISEIAGLPAIMGRSTLSDKDGKWGYNSITVTADSLLFYEENGDSVSVFLGGIERTGRHDITQTDTAGFINYNAEVAGVSDLKRTISARLCAYNGNLFAATVNGIIYCINQEGKVVWSYATGANIVSKPAVSGSILVAGTIQGDLIAIDAETGKPLQTLGVNEPVTSQLVISKIVTSEDTVDAVIAGTSSGTLICCELRSLTEIWRNGDAKWMIETEPLIVDGRVIYGSWDSYLYCVELESGRIIWKYSGNNNFYYSPAACVPVTDGKSVFIATPDKYITSIDLLLGKANWRKKESDAWESIGISEDKKRIFVKSITDKFYIISARDGKVVKSIDCRFGTDTMPVEPFETGGNIIFSTKNGFVYAIDKKYKLTPVLFTGTSRVLTVRRLSEDVFAAGNMDGKITVFRLKEIR